MSHEEITAMMKSYVDIMGSLNENLNLLRDRVVLLEKTLIKHLEENRHVDQSTTS